MKVAVLAHHVAPIRPPFAGGVESVTWYLARWLAERGHAVTMLTPWLESALRASPAPVLAAVSRATAEQWSDVADVRHVVPNGVDTGAWPLGPGGEHAVWCGRMVPEKAPHLAIDAARAAGLELRLAGPIVDGAYWQRHVAGRLGDDVRYVGHLGHADLALLIGASRVAVLTPDWEEPFGMAAAEAMATGTPVAAFARAMRVAAALPRDGVRAFARAHVGIDAMGRRYEGLYAQLIRTRRAVAV